jgi:hypothetical protein
VRTRAERMRVLILSAPVGAGHDAAAAAVAEELRLTGADVEIVDGLALLGVSVWSLAGTAFRSCTPPGHGGCSTGRLERAR